MVIRSVHVFVAREKEIIKSTEKENRENERNRKKEKREDMYSSDPRMIGECMSTDGHPLQSQRGRDTARTVKVHEKVVGVEGGRLGHCRWLYRKVQV